MKHVMASDLDSGSRVVAWAIGLHADVYTCEAWPSIPTICKASGCSRNTVRTHVARLLETGWLTQSDHGDGRGRTNRYALTVPVDNLEIKGSTIDPFTEKGVNHRPKRGQLLDVKGSTVGTGTGLTVRTGSTKPAEQNGGPVENLQPISDMPPFDETLRHYWMRVNGKAQR